MLFSIQIGGSHTEGPEANTRFEKLTADYVDALRSGGFLVDSVQAHPDKDKASSEVLHRKGKNIGPHTEPEPASWQAAVESAMKRAPAVASADLVATSNVDAVSPAALRVAATRAHPAGVIAGASPPLRGDTSDDPEASAAPTDAELTANNDPKLALKPDKQTAPQVGSFLKANDYTVAELNAAIATERAGRNRPAVVASLEASLAARVKATA